MTSGTPLQARPSVGRRRHSATTARVRLLVALTFAALPGCDRAPASEAREEQPLLVMAAASLGSAMPRLIERFESETGMSVDLSLGATGNLAAQMEHGAPADLFFSADRSTVDRLVASGTIRPESVRDYAAGELVIVWRDGLPPPRSLVDLTDARFEVIAIANPETAPYGTAARQALMSTGVWDALSSRVVRGENIAQTYQLVQTGNADAAIVARSIVDEKKVPVLPVDAATHGAVFHSAGILAESDLPRARRFLDFVLSIEGQTILARHGFAPPPDRP